MRLISTSTVSDTNKVVIDYRDSQQAVSGLEEYRLAGTVDTDNLLEDNGELAEITISGLTSALDPDLGANTLFAFESKPPKGGVLILERRTPDARSTRLWICSKLCTKGDIQCTQQCVG